jgi:hypothetical protein
LFALGYDVERASALKSALSLLNDMYDDVPEQILKQAATHRPQAQWQSVLDQSASALSTARDRRIALVRREKMEPRRLDPAHYAPPL